MRMTLPDGRAVATYDDGSTMDPVDSPRPYLHPVSTLGGTVVTDERTPDHHHHYGVSFAVPDVDGTSYWGGRTYVRDVGSTLLDNHGVQRAVSRETAPGVVTEEVEWRSHGGDVELVESRVIRASPTPSGWVLDWHSRLRAVGEVSIGSPATNGREGAFYGGLFWRTPFQHSGVLSADGEGESVAHGSRSPWLAVTADKVSLVALGDGRPWFIRAEEYVGFGPALAVDERLVVRDGESVETRLTVLVTDTPRLDRTAALALVAELEDAR